MNMWNPPVPTCVHCGRPMQLNTAVSTEFLKQYVCGCTGIIFHVNLHAGQKGKE